jgi:hypothetical protein
MVSLLVSEDYATALSNLGGQPLNDDLTALSSGGTANCIWGEKSDLSGIECKTTFNIQLDDTGAQFKSGTASKGTLKFLLSGSTDGKLLTTSFLHTDNKTLYFPDPTTGDYVAYGSAAIRFTTGGTTARVKTFSDAAATIVEYGQSGTLNISTTGTISGGTLTPVIGDADDFDNNFTGANLYGGTYIVNAAGSVILANSTVGVNFTVLLEDAVATVIEPLATDTDDTIVLNGTTLTQGASIQSSTKGAMCVIQYRAADSWMATCNGFIVTP